MTDGISEEARIPAQRLESIEPVWFTDNSQLSNMPLQAKFQDRTIHDSSGKTLLSWLAKSGNNEDPGPFKNRTVARHPGPGKSWEDVTHQVRPQARHQSGSGDHPDFGLNTEQVYGVIGIKRIDLTTIFAVEIIPSSFTHIDLMAYSERLFQIDLAPKFYPVLSSLQRFWVAVFGAEAAGCGAEPFRLCSTATRRGLMVRANSAGVSQPRPECGR